MAWALLANGPFAQSCSEKCPKFWWWGVCVWGRGLVFEVAVQVYASGIQPAWTHHFLAGLLYICGLNRPFFFWIHLGFQHHANRCNMGSALASPFPTSARDGSGLCGDQAWGWVQANPIPHEVSSISILSGNWVFKIMLNNNSTDHLSLSEKVSGSTGDMIWLGKIWKQYCTYILCIAAPI